jgi:hypothetical protein
MFTSFEIKSYPQLNFALGAVNSLLLGSCLVTTYLMVLTPEHAKSVDSVLSLITKSRIADTISVVGVSCIWGWIATHFLRLHDRLHEAHIRKWRAVYDADFILRSLLSELSGAISQEIFTRAYYDKRVCRKAMQRLFYNFVGDEAETAPGRRMFFYTVMWKYWSLALLDLYATATLVAGLLYHVITASRPNPLFFLTVAVALLVARVAANPILDEAHEITEEQIAAIKNKHGTELRREAINITTDLGL